ncbi:tyrosine-type recombinase/integrase [Actinacidiphila oryziradicis]|uniref:Tyr recombinase domain-containing protein n=1 Tax=Actinacidiphila oryziradicis TaxID=2571141 RepID=A0A4U0S1G5_9ACTN|nr:tyrosine-type recombinase/integrase [Actinacidiphila oryziradicis]TKA01948.1 hypothetical protein FCI23_39885 [Actinacidiphila oryziradicis]
MPRPRPVAAPSPRSQQLPRRDDHPLRHLAPHDLRHGAATLAHAAGADLEDIQEMLGHSSITITADTYTSLLPETDLAIAEAAARLVPRAGKADDAPESAETADEDEPSAHTPLTQTAPDDESEAA